MPDAATRQGSLPCVITTAWKKPVSWSRGSSAGSRCHLCSFGYPFELKIHRGVQPKEAARIYEVWGHRRESSFPVGAQATHCHWKPLSVLGNTALSLHSFLSSSSFFFLIKTPKKTAAQRLSVLTPLHRLLITIFNLEGEGLRPGAFSGA